jgi:hypothetical protein
MNMKRRDVVRIFNALQDLSSTAKGEFAYAIIKNLRKLDSEIAAIAKLGGTVSDKYREYNDKREELARKYSEKDESGAAVIKNNSYVLVPENTEAFNTEFAALSEEYKAEIYEYNKQTKDYNDAMEESTDVEIYRIRKENLPNDLSARDMASIMELIEGLE